MHSLKLKHIQLTIHICPFKNPIPSGQTALKQQRTCCYIRQRVKRGSKVQGRGERTRVCVCVCVCVSPQLCLHSETEVRCHKDGSSPLETAEVCQWDKQDLLTSFSASGMNNFTKLSGNTPCLPFSSPYHQPASAHPYTQRKHISSVYLCSKKARRDVNHVESVNYNIFDV